MGDSLTELKKLPDECVDCIITSPPYWALRDYKTEGIIWDGNKDCEHDFKIQSREINLVTGKSSVSKRPWRENASGQVKTGFCIKCNAWKGQLGQEPTIDLYINHLIQIFNECKRILKREGTCWVVLGDTYSGVKVGNTYGIWKDKIHPKTRRKNGMENNQDFKKDTRNEQIPEKSLCLIPERFSLKMIENKWILRNKIIWYKPNCMPSSAKDRFTVDYENIYFFTKSQRYYFKTQYEPLSEVTIKEVQRFYNGKGIKDYEGNGVQNPSDVKRSIIRKFAPIGGIKHTNGNDNRTYSGNEYNPNLEQGRIKRCVWKINTKPFPEAHFAVFPEELVKQCMDAGCKENGVSLDPFMGSGTVGLVALKSHKQFLGIELNPEYIEIANKRLEPLLKQQKLEKFDII